MKKLLSVTLLLTLLLSLCACGGTGQSDEEEAQLPELGEYDLYAGFGRENITPEEPVPMGGYSNAKNRIHTNVLDDLYVTCIALTDAQGETILLMNWDGVRSYDTVQEAVRYQIYGLTGVPVERIYIGATHSHSCPEMNNAMESAQRYMAYVIDQATACAIEALEDRKPANMSAGTIETENLNFVRHYMTTLDDGSVTYFGDNFNTAVYNDSTKHTSEVDETMFMLFFSRENGDDLAFINWRAHPHFTGGSSKYDLSSDWCGPFRDAFEYQTNVKMLYYNGAAGNVNEKSRISAENRTSDYKEYGALLAGYAIELMEKNLKEQSVDKIQTSQTMFEGKINHSMDHLATKAKELQSVWNSTGNAAMVKELGEPYGIRSPYHANAIAANATRGETQQRELNAIMLGDNVSLVTAPNELFDTNSMWLEENAPTEFTLTLGYTNGHYGYIPSALAWEYTSYETDITFFVPGTAEQYQECFLDMINSMKEN